MLKVACVFLHVQCQPCAGHGTRSMPVISALWNGSRLGCRDGATINSQICDHLWMSACSRMQLHYTGWNSNMSTIHMQTISDIILDLLKTASSSPTHARTHAHTSPLCFSAAGLGVQLSVFLGEQMELQQHSFSVRSSEKLPVLPERRAHRAGGFSLLGRAQAQISRSRT